MYKVEKATFQGIPVGNLWHILREDNRIIGRAMYEGNSLAITWSPTVRISERISAPEVENLIDVLDSTD